MSSVKTGDIVKSLDFNGIDNCYMVGLVVSVSEMDKTFRAKLLKRVWEGKVDKKSDVDFFVAPLQGNMIFDNEKTPRIQVLA